MGFLRWRRDIIIGAERCIEIIKEVVLFLSLHSFLLLLHRLFLRYGFFDHGCWRDFLDFLDGGWCLLLLNFWLFLGHLLLLLRIVSDIILVAKRGIPLIEEIVIACDDFILFFLNLVSSGGGSRLLILNELNFLIFVRWQGLV